MSTNAAEFSRLLAELLPTLRDQYQVESLGIFGSYVRQAQRKNSDLDLLVTFREPPTLLKFIELENYIADRLGIKVDLVMRDSLKPTIAQSILREVVPI